jgi:hypothetical protein
MRNKEFYFPGVIIAGLVGILPALASSCCCLCGALTAFIGLLGVALVRKKSGGIPIELGEASLIGLISGGLTAILAIAVNVLARFGAQPWVAQLQADMGNDRLRTLDLTNNVTAIVLSAVFAVFIHAGSGALGGLLAVPLLRTGEGSAPPSA